MTRAELRFAAMEWAAATLPDTSAIGGQSPYDEARKLEARAWAMAQRVPDGVHDVDAWRDACREALIVRIQQHYDAINGRVD